MRVMRRFLSDKKNCEMPLIDQKLSDQSYLQSKEVPSYASPRIVRRNEGLLNPSE